MEKKKKQTKTKLLALKYEKRYNEIIKSTNSISNSSEKEELSLIESELEIINYRLLKSGKNNRFVLQKFNPVMNAIKKEKKRLIESDHKKTGFKEKRAKFIQGGLTGLKK